MKTRLLFLSLPFFFISKSSSQTITALFTSSDTVCVNQNVSVQNTSTGSINTHYWSFCLGSLNSVPVATNMGNLGSAFSSPVYYSVVKDAGVYYAFVSNNSPGGLVRLTYGNSLLNAPVVTNLGNLGVLPGSLEDLHLEKQGANWYGIMVGGIPGGLFRLSFGTSLANVPTAVNLGNVGNLNYPQRIQAFWSGGNFYAFTPNRNSNTITRIDFGNSITNTPTGTNLGTIGALSTPDDMAIINYFGNWYAFVVNEGDNTLTRLDFGNSLLTTPTGVNLGNTGALNGPRGIDVFVECGEVKGLITNRISNDLLKMNFLVSPTGPLTTTSYGNIGTFSFPHSIERFRIADTLFAMIPNVSNNSLTRIYYPGCLNASVPSSNVQNPPAFSYNQTGTYYIHYIANEGQINQSVYCKKIEVIPSPGISVLSKTICTGAKATLTVSGATSYSWNTNQTTSTIQVSPTVTTVYTVQGWNTANCKASATVQVKVNACTGLETFYQLPEFSIYPNPNSGEFVIQSNQTLELELYNQLGQIIKHLSLSSENSFQQKVSGLNKGIYFVGSTQSQAVENKKIVVLN